MAQARLEPLLFVIFGATGDLSRKKLLPALSHLKAQRRLPSPFALLGVTRHDLSDDAFLRLVNEDAGISPAPWQSHEVYHTTLKGGDADAYAAVVRRMEEIEGRAGLPGNRLVYLALPPETYADTVTGLGPALAATPGFVRLVVEKPFGEDLATARALNATIHRYFDESQIYRIDHYLGKETVQNLLVFRFANAIFESLWNRQHIERVEILVAESIGIEGRAQYYDHAGALRDMIQNHLMQVLSAVAMEIPSVRAVDGVRDEKVKVLHAIVPPSPDNVVFGQYGPGAIDGKPVPGYRQEPGVAPDSRTETFVALRLFVDNWRWEGVPFVLRTGKRLSRRQSRVRLFFRRPPVGIFRQSAGGAPDPNILDVILQPDEGFDLLFSVKVPGPEMVVETESLSFRYGGAFGDPLADAYETLLLDVMEGDPSLFVRADWVESSWAIFDDILHAAIPIHIYPAGSDGPRAADRL